MKTSTFFFACIAAVCLGSATAYAQNYHWAKSIGATSIDYGTSIAVDSSGNVYITGSFSDTADFDPGAGTANLTPAGSQDIFFAKYIYEYVGIPAYPVNVNHTWNVYPNPSGGAFTLEHLSGNSGPVKVRIMNYTGATVYSRSFTQIDRYIIHIPGAPSGVYNLLIETEDGQIMRKRLVLIN